MAVSDIPSNSDVLVFLQKVLQSPGFAHSQRLRRFLSFAVETKLAGNVDRLKESIIGMEVFDRSAGYDPKLDAIVRVEAHRLRGKLLEYYSTEGAGDTLRFVLPKGSYVPEFALREADTVAAPAAAAQDVPMRDIPTQDIPAQDTPPRWPHRGLLWILAAAPLLLGAGVWISSRIAPAERPLPRFFTTFPGSETRPAFSPDGQSIAYVWSGDASEGIYVQRIDSDTPLRITHSHFDETVPTWSPDGSRIAFLRRNAANRIDLMEAAAVGGSERKVAEEATDFTTYLALCWTPDGKYLVTSDRETPQSVRRIARFDIATGARTWLTAPPNIPGDTMPAVSPDGQGVVFRRAFDEAVHDLFVLEIPRSGAAPGEPKRLTDIQRGITGVTWTADGKGLVFGAKLNGSSDGLWRVPLSGGPVQPIAEAGEGALWPAVAPRGEHLAWCRGAYDVNIIELRLDRNNTTRPLVASTLVDTSPQFSPNGSRIAFRSTRTGSHEIWVADSDGTHIARLTDIKGPLAGSPRWSPDGSTIAFDSRQSGNSDIYLLPVRGGAARRLTDSDDNESVPSWSRDGRFVYFASDRSGRSEVWKEPAAGGAAQQVTHGGGFTAFESPDARYLYFSKGPAADGLWRVPVAGGPEEPVLPNLSRRMWGNWVVVEKGIYFIDYDNPEEVRSAWLRYYSFETRAAQKISKLANPPAAWDNGLAISPDGKTVLYSQVDRYGYDIMLLPNFR